MRLIRIIFLVLVLAGLPLAGFCAEAGSAPAAAHAKPEGLPPSAVPVFNIGPFPVTNSILVTWIVAVGIIVFAQYATRKLKDVPDGAQNFAELMVETLYDFLEGVLGAELGRRTFWFFATIFLFIFFTNWFGLFPGVGTIGWGVQTPDGFELMRPWLRGGNADLNMTLAMSAIFMVCWVVWALQSNGLVGSALHIFGPKGESTGFLKVFMIAVFFVVGVIEVVSISFRPISLSFRLYGNVFAGESLLDAMSKTIQHPVWARHVFAALLPVPFYFLELLVGFVQALVFMLLTAVFTSVMCAHEEEAHEAHH